MIVMMSPKGGRVLNGIWAGISAVANISVRPKTVPDNVEDLFAWKVGYVDRDLQKGEPVYIKKSDAQKLFRVMRLYV